ncbi:hypothetical protein HZD82_25275, partial [Pantoea agglomerans]
RAADTGISVDSAADVAKASSDIILLEKDLQVLNEGVLKGRVRVSSCKPHSESSAAGQKS